MALRGRKLRYPGWYALLRRFEKCAPPVLRSLSMVKLSVCFTVFELCFPRHARNRKCAPTESNSVSGLPLRIEGAAPRSCPGGHWTQPRKLETLYQIAVTESVLILARLSDCSP